MVELAYVVAGLLLGALVEYLREKKKFRELAQKFVDVLPENEQVTGAITSVITEFAEQLKQVVGEKEKENIDSKVNQVVEGAGETGKE